MIKVILLGIIQGLTEFLPVSSSGHLAAIGHYLKIESPIALAVILHFGTLLATVIFFRKPIKELIKGLIKFEPASIRYLGWIVIGNVPIAVFALLLRNVIEKSFFNMIMVAVFLGLTGIVVLATAFFRKGEKRIGLFQAVIIGIAQMLAVFPGLSRSGLTISAGIITRVEPEEAFRFSFLLSLPAILGAHLLELKGIGDFGNPLVLAVGSITSFLAGLVALWILRNFVSKRFFYFGVYCLILSVVLMLIK